MEITMNSPPIRNRMTSLIILFFSPCFSPPEIPMEIMEIPTSSGAATGSTSSHGVCAVHVNPNHASMNMSMYIDYMHKIWCIHIYIYIHTV